MDLPDYKNYTFRQLYEALDGIRADLYPESLKALEAEIRSRQDVAKSDLEEAYFRLDHRRYPAHKKHLAELINAQGGFDTIAPERVTDENRYHTGWRRFWALVFDSLIIQVVLGAALAPILSRRPDDIVLATMLGFVSQLAVILYYVLMHAIRGQTLGKMITGVKVVRNADESPIGLTQALMRDVASLALLAAALVALPYSDIVVIGGKEAALKPPAMVTAVTFLSFLWGITEILTMLFSKKRRALHDLIARTVVVRYVRSQQSAAGTKPSAEGAVSQATQ